MIKKIVSFALATICATSMITGSAAAMETDSMYNGDTYTPPLSGLDLYNYYMEVGEVPPIFDETDDYGISPNGIIDGEDRTLVTDTSIAPYKAIGRLYVSYTDQEGKRVSECGTCSAFASNAVLTAAHCVYDIGTNQVMTFKKIEFGLNGDTYVYKTITSEPKEIIISPEYMDGNKAASTDWAIILFDNKISNWAFGYSTALASSTTLTITGYPGKGSVEGANNTGKEQYICSGNASNINDSFFNCNIDTTKGQSGSPIYNSALHIVGVFNMSSTQVSTARRVKGELYEIMAAIRAGTYSTT